MSETIKLDPSTNKLEFDVVLQNVDGFEVPQVRFVTSSAQTDMETIHKCVRVEGEKNKWSTTIPRLDESTGDTHNFRIEVIVDGYFFEAASGTLEVQPLIESTRPKVRVDIQQPMLVEAEQEHEDGEDEEALEPQDENEDEAEDTPRPVIPEAAVPVPTVTKSDWKNVRKQIFKRS